MAQRPSTTKRIETDTETETKSNRFGQEDDATLAQELNALSVHEREQIYEEIHGIATIIDETPDIVASSLHQMRQELALIPRRKRGALDRAMFLRPSLTTDDNFHLMFLRACRFDPKGAATKMHRYFTNKLELFGEDKLTKTITLDDLDAKDMRILRQGVTQFIPVNEERGVIGQYTLVAATADVHDWKASMRCLWYRLKAVLEDVEVQKRGIVEIVNLRGKWKISVPDMLGYLVKCSHILNDRPVRICAFHVLFEEEGGAMSLFVGAANKLVCTDIRMRQRFHVGSDLETQYSLMTFGIKLQDCFALGQGIFGLEHIDSYLQYRREKDREILQQEAAGATSAEHLLYPRQQDVLMGRGRPYQTWPGNIRLTNLVLDHTDRYTQATEQGFDKTTIVSYIVGLVERDNHGYFLQRTDVDWQKVKEQAARNKVSQLLRAEARNRRQGRGGGGIHEDMIMYENAVVPPPTSSSSSSSPGGGAKRRRLHGDF